MDQIDRVVFPHPGSRGSQAAGGSWELECDFTAVGRISGPDQELLTKLPVWREMVNGCDMCLSSHSCWNRRLGIGGGRV